MEGRDNQLESGEDKSTELEIELSKDLTKKSLQEEIADTANITDGWWRSTCPKR